MKRLLTCILLGLQLGWAQTAGHAFMILGHTGTFSRELDTGRVFQENEKLSLPAGSQVTLLILGQGKRVSVSAGSDDEVWVEQGAVRTHSARVNPIEGNHHRLHLTGDNHRQVAGLVVRAAYEHKVESTPYTVEVTPQMLQISCAKNSPAAASTLNLEFYFPYRPQSLNERLDGLTGLRTEPKERLHSARLVGSEEGEKRCYRYLFPSDWAEREWGVKLSGGPHDFYFPIYVPTEEHLEELKRLQKDTSPEGLLIYAAAAEEVRQPTLALSALEKVIANRPDDDPGLYVWRARLQLDMGKYAEAITSMKKSLEAETNARRKNS